VVKLKGDLLWVQQEHDHIIPLIPGSEPPNVHPYFYPFAQMNEIEKII
jgi:hypothetical protein